MSKPKQKQSTLFRAWGGSSHSSSTAGVGSTGEQAARGGEEYGFENFDDLEEFFQDDVTDELAHDPKTLPASKGSRSVLNASIIEDIPGFDVDAGQLWIYPTNYPIRDYQFNIVQKALFKNTLVCLPTGLGKTFIAAVVMYNFYRWYPSQKILFLAPTKPLVSQQIEACYNVAGIPQEHAAEMTGVQEDGRIGSFNYTASCVPLTELHFLLGEGRLFWNSKCTSGGVWVRAPPCVKP